jgi:hypothetical protein
MHWLVQLHFTDFLMIWLRKKSCEIHADVRVMTAEGFSLIITNFFFSFLLSFSSFQTVAQICSRHLILPHLKHLLICIWSTNVQFLFFWVPSQLTCSVIRQLTQVMNTAHLVNSR